MSAPPPEKKMADIMPHYQRMNQHQHNSHRGRLGMAKSCLNSIMGSSSITPELREAIGEILPQIDRLKPMLDWRINADGRMTKVKWSR